MKRTLAALILLAAPMAQAQDTETLAACMSTEADPTTCIGIIANPCLETADTVGTERVCFDAETDAWRGTARDVFNAAAARLGAIGDSLPAVLMSSQDGWDDYVNNACTLLRLADPDKERRELTEARCKMERTGARIIEIMNLAVE